MKENYGPSKPVNCVFLLSIERNGKGAFMLLQASAKSGIFKFAF